MLLDTLRMIAYRAKTATATAVADGLDNPDIARSLLKALFRGDASRHAHRAHAAPACRTVPRTWPLPTCSTN